MLSKISCDIVIEIQNNYDQNNFVSKTESYNY